MFWRESSMRGASCLPGCRSGSRSSFSPCGRRCLREAKADEGLLPRTQAARLTGLDPRIETPHPASLREATLSHKGRGYAGSRRVAVRGDDLVGVTAGDFGHALELPGEAAGAGRGRAQLDDEIADLRLRHGGADAIPAAPAFAGVEAKDL